MEGSKAGGGKQAELLGTPNATGRPAAPRRAAVPRRGAQHKPRTTQQHSDAASTFTFPTRSTPVQQQQRAADAALQPTGRPSMRRAAAGALPSVPDDTARPSPELPPSALLRMPRCPPSSAPLPPQAAPAGGIAAHMAPGVGWWKGRTGEAQEGRDGASRERTFFAGPAQNPSAIPLCRLRLALRTLSASLRSAGWLGAACEIAAASPSAAPLPAAGSAAPCGRPAASPPSSAAACCAAAAAAACVCASAARRRCSSAAAAAAAAAARSASRAAASRAASCSVMSSMTTISAAGALRGSNSRNWRSREECWTGRASSCCAMARGQGGLRATRIAFQGPATRLSVQQGRACTAWARCAVANACPKRDARHLCIGCYDRT